MNLELLAKIKQSFLDTPLVRKPRSDEFAGVYLHSNSPFAKEKHEGPIRSFRLFTQYEYPLYIFISLDALTEDFNYIVNNYGDIRIEIIPTLKNIYEFNEFSINNLLYYIDPKHNNLLYFQEDSGFIKEGVEELCQGYSWLGAPWKEKIRVIEDKFNFDWIQVGNGGHNFRKRDKCLKVLDFVKKHGGQTEIVQGLQIEGKHRTYSPFLAEDAFFCHFGFGAEIFEPVSLEHARKFSLEPITYKQFLNKESVGYHRIDE